MTPVSQFKSAPTVFTYDDGRKTYAPSNYNDKYANDFIDMRQAIASSDNIYAVNTIMKVGPDERHRHGAQARHRQPDEAGAVAGARHVPCQSVRDGFRFRHVRERRRACRADGDPAHRGQQRRGAV